MGRLAWIIWVGPVQSQGLLKMDKGGGRVTQSDVSGQKTSDFCVCVCLERRPQISSDSCVFWF